MVKIFIILRTNARKGKDNIELGSFTESLMIYTSTPLMVINPQLKTPTTVQTHRFSYRL